MLDNQGSAMFVTRKPFGHQRDIQAKIVSHDANNIEDSFLYAKSP